MEATVKTTSAMTTIESLQELTFRARDLRTPSGWFAMLRGRVNGGFGVSRVPPEPLWISVESAEEYSLTMELLAKESKRRRNVELALTDESREFHVDGFCRICEKSTRFHVDYSYSLRIGDREIPNWREHLKCPGCNMNNRMRAAAHFFELALARPSEAPRVYMTEQCTPIFTAMSRRFPGVVGSEHLGSLVPLGDRAENGIRNEDLTQLTFEAARFDCVISLDVLEHVGDLPRALSECSRVLCPGGALLFTVPFYPERLKNLVRAVEDPEGGLTHLLPPEYHGDPLSSSGCLAFHHFGWELLDQIIDAGFHRVFAIQFWSRGYGYLGEHNHLFIAFKSDPAERS